MNDQKKFLVIGAGPAGLTAAYELMKQEVPAVVAEKDDMTGGLSRTVEYGGYRFDVGGHRFFTKVNLIRNIWHEVLGDEFIKRPRLSRIYYNKKFFDYPLKPLNAFKGLGVTETFRIISSYLRYHFRPLAEENDLEHWLTNRFGKRLYQIFFKTYSEKVWGRSCTEISADWASQRIKNLDLMTAVKNLFAPLKKKNNQEVTTLIEEFHYPRLGPGQMWEKMRSILEQNDIPVNLSARVIKIKHQNGLIKNVTIRNENGEERIEKATHFISSMPLREMIRIFDPPLPPHIIETSDNLEYRDFLTAVLMTKRSHVFPDNWIYIHSPELKVSRMQNFKNWSSAMVPDQSRTSLGLEYFVQKGDELWNAPDEDIINLGLDECIKMGFLNGNELEDGQVIRMRYAYPVYTIGYEKNVMILKNYLERFKNLALIGRNAQHRYNNQDHSMLTGIYAARRLCGEPYDEWEVNTEEDYLE